MGSIPEQQSVTINNFEIYNSTLEILKKTLLITIAILLFKFSAYGQEIISVKPSYYFTYGDYSNGNITRTHSVYSTINIDNGIFPTVGYENQNIFNNQLIQGGTKTSYPWKYNQQSFLGGVFYSAFPDYSKFYYTHIMGDFKLNQNDYLNSISFDYSKAKYSDYTNIYTFDYSRYYDGWSFGGVVTYLNAIGHIKIIDTVVTLNHQQTMQGTARIEYAFSPDIFLSVKPSYFYSMIDKRKLWSAAIKFHYLAAESLLLKAGGIVGKRAYYFDSDLLTVFNQDDTQKQCAFVSTEVFPGDGFTLTAAFLYSEFTDYHINYYVAGVRRFF